MVPGAHWFTSTQLPALMLELYLPGAHTSQTRSVVEEPAVATYCPGWQSVQTVQLEAFCAPLKAPEAHPTHATSLVGLPCVCT